MISYKLFAKQGDLLTAKADFAVNPSNTAMLLGSGVSMAFKRSCGVILEKYMQDALKNRGVINQGNVIKTASNEKINKMVKISEHKRNFAKFTANFTT